MREFAGGYAEVNTEMNRLQLFFDEKPNEQQRAVLKAGGFKWAPSQDAWQRQLTDNAIYSAGRIDFIKSSDGKTVREHQPNVPVRDGVASEQSGCGSILASPCLLNRMTPATGTATRYEQ